MRFMGYRKSMLENIKIYTSDKFWKQIFADLGLCVSEKADIADVVFDDIHVKPPISVTDLKNVIFAYADSPEIIKKVFSEIIVLPKLQHKIIVNLYKKPDISINELKALVGLSPDITTHTVENTIYQLRKKFGHDIIQNINGKYRIGHI